MKSLTTLVAALALGSLAFAADEPAKPAPAPGAAPAAPAEGEKKPRLSPEEAFKKLDTNNDGSLSLDEFKASPRFATDASKAEEAFKKMDTNSDGKVTLEEFKAARAARGGAKKPQ